MSLTSVQHSNKRWRRLGESRPGSYRRTTEWLWIRLDIMRALHPQKINRQEFDRTLKGKPQVLDSNTQLRKGEKRKKKKKKEDPEVPATPAAKRLPRSGSKGDKGETTPRSEETKCSLDVKRGEGKDSCIFYAFGLCKAAKYEFLRDD